MPPSVCGASDVPCCVDYPHLDCITKFNIRPQSGPLDKALAGILSLRAFGTELASTTFEVPQASLKHMPFRAIA